MAESNQSAPPVGPGQQESTGFGKSLREPEPAGLYYHPGSKQYIHVQHYAAADAVVRQGFQLVEEGHRLTPSMEAKLTQAVQQSKKAIAEMEGEEWPPAEEPKEEASDKPSTKKAEGK